MSEDWLVSQFKKLPCMACGNPNSEIHHIKTRGSGGKDDPWNIIPLCSDDHTQASWAIHRNKTKFFNRYPHVKDYLIELGWDFNGPKLFHKLNNYKGEKA